MWASEAMMTVRNIIKFSNSSSDTALGMTISTMGPIYAKKTRTNFR